MKNMKRMLALVLVLTMVLCLCACGDNKSDEGKDLNTKSTNGDNNDKGDNSNNGNVNNGNSNNNNDNNTTTTGTSGNNGGDISEPVDYVYTVTVKDDAGNPISGVWVQICAGTSCVPKQTDANGVAGYDAEVTGDGELTAKIVTVPEGYIAETMEIVMDGENNVEFVLQRDYAYTVQVITVEDMGVAGVWVQICAGDACVPKQTDANGLAAYEEAINGDGALTAKLISIPAGYVLAEGESMEIVLEDGNTDAVFVLKAA